MLTHPHIFYKIKTPFQRNSVLLTEHRVAPVVTLYFRVTRVICMAPHGGHHVQHHCHLRDTIPHHLEIYRECYGFERTLFTLRHFLLCIPSCFFKPSHLNFNLNLKVSRASYWSSSSTDPTIYLNHCIPQKIYVVCSI